MLSHATPRQAPTLKCEVPGKRAKFDAFAAGRQGSSEFGRRSVLGLGAVLIGSRFLGTDVAEAMSEQIDAADKIEFGPLNGSIRGCPTSVNPNCISTGSLNKTYGPAWRSGSATIDATVERIIDAVPQTCPGSELVALKSVDEKQYIAFWVDGPFGKDTVEFLVKPDTTASRNWEGDIEGPLVTYRAIAGKVKYIYPIQQPITDFDAQRKRMDAIRARLGWRVIGCELIECYQ
ncbi:hypothetical protein BSKO_13874 [Bryopsis sp. KO-2023]|nr:hypothetical protein BSKO_13874 [Bryopsis sp. KO-2023]